jgi:DNA primase large subunit
LNKVRAYYSGRRGLHLYIDLEPIRIGDLRKASEYVAELLGIIDYVDKHVLGDWRRMSRVPYSYHNKSGNMCDVINPTTNLSLSRELVELLEKFKLKSQRYVVNLPQETREVVNQLGEPPLCISFLLNQLISGADLSHAARIHIGAYLMSLGLKPEEASILFANVPDYNEQITLYQLRWLREHNYKMFSCQKAKQYGLCPLGMFEVCQYYPTPNRFFDKL